MAAHAFGEASSKFIRAFGCGPCSLRRSFDEARRIA
jgi:hypothetical protein